VNLFEALARCAGHLTKFGGHAGAAGMSIAIGQLEPFRAAFAAEAARQLGAGQLSAALSVDAEVTLRDLDLGFAEELARLAPFGVANREPLFALSGVTTRATRRVGKDHLQLTLDHGGTTSEAIAFGFADADPGAGACVDLVATAELDTFRGTTRARLKVSKLARTA
jgi:single-stranded-DNA-specific exonuclease